MTEEQFKKEKLRAEAYYEAGVTVGALMLGVRMGRGPSIDPDREVPRFPYIPDKPKSVLRLRTENTAIILLAAEAAQHLCNLPPMQEMGQDPCAMVFDQALTIDWERDYSARGQEDLTRLIGEHLTEHGERQRHIWNG